MYTPKKDVANWYNEIVAKAGLIDNYDISGCYIIRPDAYEIWENVVSYLDPKLKQLGLRNCYFPMFVTEESMQLEKDHLDDFKPELAYIDVRHGEKDGNEKNIAIRPTSESIMYPTFKKWLNSYRDLPIKINQYCSVVRWETKACWPFLRTREFLWHEGHTAHQTKDEALVHNQDILDLYIDIFENQMAIPIVPGVKSVAETFAGNLITLLKWDF